MSINTQWKPYIEQEFKKEYFQKITQFLKSESLHEKVYPPSNEIYSALSVAPENVKVIIVGQDPYHGAGQANGLAFSVKKGITIPPSLKNIYKELKLEYSKDMPNHGDLTNWKNQGVLLLNTSLTVKASTPGSHSNIGWIEFTDKIITTLSDNFEHNVYILWGAHAKAKASLIDTQKNLVLSSAHPSPFSVTKFYGNNHFLKANEYLKQHGRGEIDWFDL